MRLRGVRDPGAGLSEWSPMRCSAIDPHQVLHGLDEAAHGRVVLALDGAADLAEAERLERVVLLAARAVRGLHLGDGQLAHQAGASSDSGTGSILSPPPPSSATLSRPSRPSTSRTVSPRSWATWSGLRSSRSASTVAFTRLIGFWLPSDFDSTSWMPASSSTARTPPPAITPVPGEAGFS